MTREEYQAKAAKARCRAMEFDDSEVRTAWLDVARQWEYLARLASGSWWSLNKRKDHQASRPVR
jgi:hypothetical protein